VSIEEEDTSCFKDAKDTVVEEFENKVESGIKHHNHNP
jgi:hypothetical protein